MGDEGRRSRCGQNKKDARPVTRLAGSRLTISEVDRGELSGRPRLLIAGARTGPIGCNEPIRAYKEKHPLGCRLRKLEEYSRTRNAHKTNDLKRKGRNSTFRPLGYLYLTTGVKYSF